jgi:aquaporin Z
MPQRSTSTREQTEGSDRVDDAGWARHYLAELVGAFILTFVAAGALVVRHVSHGEVSPAAAAVAPGLVVGALIYSVGDVSGAHFNPVVTLAFALRRVFPWPMVPGYWLCQLVGAATAGLTLHGLFGSDANVGRTLPRFGDGKAFVFEIALTAILVLVIVSTATRHSLIGSETAIAVGGTIALCGLFGGPIGGASMNPARSLGPAIVAGAGEHAWVYVAGPALGAALAVGLATLLHPYRTGGEHEAAKGDGKQ